MFLGNIPLKELNQALLKSHQPSVKKKAAVRRMFVFKTSLMRIFLQPNSLKADLLSFLRTSLLLVYIFKEYMFESIYYPFPKNLKICQYGFL